MSHKPYTVSEARMKFYNSRKWRNFRKAYVAKVRGLCENEHCGKAGKELHHIKALNDYNLDDVEISLNEDNVKFLCTECHNAERASAYIREGLQFDSQGNLIERESHRK